MNWEQLIAIARLLAGSPEHGPDRGRPQQMHLRRAASCAYYAMFHAMATSNADTLVGASPQLRRRPAWTRTYRALEHGFARSMILGGLSGFSVAIQDFGSMFTALQDQRHHADYDPEANFSRRETLQLIDVAEAAIKNFMAADPAERRDFAVHVLFRRR